MNLKKKKTSVAHSCSTTCLDSIAPLQMELRPRKAVIHCVRCHNHGFADQIQNHMHFCLFQNCHCDKCAFFAKYGRAMPAEGSLTREQGTFLEDSMAGALVKKEASSPKNRSSNKNLPGTVPACSAELSDTRIFVSIVDNSSLDEATNNFSFQGFAQESCPAQQAPDQAPASATPEQQAMLEAAEALLILKYSVQASCPGFISPP